jgi:threonine dehydrogenase-like Zn-dependent dehydrogenase
LSPAWKEPPAQTTAIADIMPLLTDADPLGVETFAAHRIGLDEAPAAYRAFAVKRDGHVKVLLKP